LDEDARSTLLEGEAFETGVTPDGVRGKTSGFTAVASTEEDGLTSKALFVD